MGLFSTNLADKWQDWTTKIGLDPYAKHESFRINPEGNKDIAVFTKKLEELSDDFIKQYDKNDDGKISYEELEAFEEAQLKENLPDVDEGTLKLAKEGLRRTFDKLNVDNENDSKDNLDLREVMNYFHTMAAFNTETTVDGSVSAQEYRLMTKVLAEKPQGENLAACLEFYLKGNFDGIYRNYKKD